MIVVIKRNASRINNLRDEVANEVTDQDKIHNLILSTRIFIHRSRWCTQGEIVCLLGEASVGNIPSPGEIRKAIFSMKPLKTPSLNVYHPIFF